MIHLNYRDTRPIYSQIIEGLKDQIRAGILQDGDKLPSVRELAGQLAINPNTIQRAYRELELQGWIATAAGKGCFVCGMPGEGGEDRELWDTLDQAAAALLKKGISPEELIRHLTQGGKDHA